MRTATCRLPGQPDHACELIAEALVDEYLRRDPASRIRLTVTGGRGLLFVAGDVLSSADFDVSACVKRAAGSLGVADELEPFISLEPVTPERVASARLACDAPVTVTGYATNETPEQLPATAALARQIAKRLNDKRLRDPDWFWLGPDAEITVMADVGRPPYVIIRIEHGNEPLSDVRRRTVSELDPFVGGAKLDINPTGVCERRGLAAATGSSDATISPYGSLVPHMPSIAGRDPFSAEKAGTWLARAAARKLVKHGARAALVQASYLPGEMRPAQVRAKDERGRDCASLLGADDLHLERMKEWLRPGLNFDAAMWGFSGEAGMPWEE
ncbi:hypothetical protein HY479_01395 [Candidatus Uhrbacteria bacterium]|nr:hypothetical protein [Candidatus Uhrbacteria bacterium]